MALHCPDCKQPLRSTLYEDVQVNFCLQCKGFFLGKAHLRQIVKIRDAVIPRDARPPRRRGPETPRTCPQCQRTMKKGKYGKLSTTHFDLCESCDSLWLDQGELDAIQLDFEMVADNLARSRNLAAPATTRPEAAPAATAASTPPPTAGAGFQCPKCGHPQPRGSECARCGIIFAKYDALQQERAAHAAGAAAQTARVEEVLAQIDGFEVLQQHHLTEALVGFERANRYEVRPVPASATRGNWQIEETNKSGFSILGRNLFGLWYTFTMNVLDENRSRVLMLERRARLYFMHLDVFDENGRLIGAARRRFSWLNRVVSVQDERGRELMQIVGPLHRPWTFLLRREGREAGSIEKRWTGVLKEAYTDADRFTMRLAGELDSRCKRLALGGLMLIDSLFFEGKRPFIGHFLGAPGAQILSVALIAGALLFAGDVKMPNQFEPPPPAQARSGGAQQQKEFQSLLDRRRDLASLSAPGRYTVVEVYLDTCTICRKLESGFPGFLAARPDVTIQRVHFPESGISFSATGSTQQEVDRQAREFQELMTSFQICGTPHVEIYGPQQEIIARDVCGDKSGTLYLRKWIAAETRTSIRSLLTDAGTTGVTPLPGH